MKDYSDEFKADAVALYESIDHPEWARNIDFTHAWS